MNQVWNGSVHTYSDPLVARGTDRGERLDRIIGRNRGDQPARAVDDVSEGRLVGLLVSRAVVVLDRRPKEGCAIGRRDNMDPLRVRQRRRKDDVSQPRAKLPIEEPVLALARPESKRLATRELADGPERQTRSIDHESRARHSGRRTDADDPVALALEPDHWR